MAGTVVKTEEVEGSIKMAKFAWTTTSGGTASATTTESYNGKILALATDPGSTTPSDNWDVTMLDKNSMDVLLGAGADRDQTNTEYVASASLGAVVNSTLNCVVINGGDAKTGTVYVYVR